MKQSEVKNVLKKAIQEKLPILLVGAPGIGKTDICGQAAAEVGAEFYVEFPAISDPTDSKGIPATIDGQALWLQYARHKIYCNTDKLTVVLLDDLGQAAPAVQASYMQWILARRIGDSKVSDNVCFIAATNRREDRAGVSGILEPVKSRFAAIIEMETDLDAWLEGFALKNMTIETIAFNKFRPQYISAFEPSNNFKNSSSPRTIANADKLYRVFGPHYELIAGAAGEKYASEFIGFCKIYKSLPNINKLIANPEGADIPAELSTLYALCAALAHKADDVNFGNIVKYLDRLSPEFSVFTVKTAVQFKPDLQNTKVFQEWILKNKDLLI